MEALLEDKGYCSAVCWCKLLLLTPCLPWYVTLLPGDWWGWGTSYLKGNLCPDFRQIRGEQRTLPASVCSQLTLAQNNPYAKGAYFGEMYSGTFRCHFLWENLSIVLFFLFSGAIHIISQNTNLHGNMNCLLNFCSHQCLVQYPQ